MAKHKGMREFSAEELSGVALGQNGFKILEGVDFICGGAFKPPTETATGGNTIDYFIALKVVDVDAEVEARSVTEGDDLTLASTGKFDGSSPVSLVNGDIVYGAFNRVEVAGSDYVIAYIGK
tara:strand:+ start:846 stop:1211 length:366 start_codon:yes stop_codon:yes gene_type:complete